MRQNKRSDKNHDDPKDDSTVYNGRLSVNIQPRRGRSHKALLQNNGGKEHKYIKKKKALLK